MAELFELDGGVETTSLDGAYGMYLVRTDGGGNPIASGFVTLATLAAWVAAQEVVVPAGAPQSTLQVELTANESISGSSDTAVPWDAIVENTSDGELSWSAGNPSRITIGAGVTRVMIIGQARWATGTGSRYHYIAKNGSAFKGTGRFVGPAQAADTISATVVSEVAVSSGDYIELRAFHTQGSAQNIETNNATFMKVIVTERSGA